MARRAFSDSTQVQSLLFDNTVWSVAAAKGWAKRHGFRHGKADNRAANVRLRQRDPGDYQPGTFRTIAFGSDTGIKAVIGVPRRENPFHTYRAVPYYTTAGVYRVDLDGEKHTFGHSRGGKRGMEAYIDAWIEDAAHGQRLARNPASKLELLKHHLHDVEEAAQRHRPDVARYLYREAAVYLPRARKNPACAIGDRVTLADGRRGTVIAFRHGGMADIDVGRGIVVRQPSHSLLHTQG